MFRIKENLPKVAMRGKIKKIHLKTHLLNAAFSFFLAGNEMRVGGLLTRLVGLRTGE